MASASRTQRATKLRHTPINIVRPPSGTQNARSGDSLHIAPHTLQSSGSLFLLTTRVGPVGNGLNFSSRVGMMKSQNPKIIISTTSTAPFPLLLLKPGNETFLPVNAHPIFTPTTFATAVNSPIHSFGDFKLGQRFLRLQIRQQAKIK